MTDKKDPDPLQTAEVPLIRKAGNSPYHGKNHRTDADIQKIAQMENTTSEVLGRVLVEVLETFAITSEIFNLFWECFFPIIYHRAVHPEGDAGYFKENIVDLAGRCDLLVEKIRHELPEKVQANIFQYIYANRSSEQTVHHALLAYLILSLQKGEEGLN